MRPRRVMRKSRTSARSWSASTDPTVSRAQLGWGALSVHRTAGPATRADGGVFSMAFQRDDGGRGHASPTPPKEKREPMSTNVLVVIGAGSIGQAIARRTG